MGESRGLKLGSLVGIALGTVVGAGVVTVTGQAIASTGRSAWLAYMIATVAGFFMVVPYALLANCIRPKGGNYTITAALLGKRWGGFIGISAILIIFNMSLWGSGFGQYINSLIPSVSQSMAGILGITFFFILNMFGINKMSRVQNILSVILFMGLVTFIILGIGNVKPELARPSSPEFMTGGTAGLGAAITLLVSSTVGHKNIVNFTQNAVNSKRDVPKALAITSAIILVLYVGIAFVNCTILPLEEVAGQSLTNVAKTIMPGTLFYLFIIGGPLAALSTTINSGFAILSNPIRQAAKDGWFPKAIAKTNKNGAPYIAYAIAYVVGILPILLGLSIRVITNNIVLIVSINEFIVFLAISQLPKKIPEAWEKRYYRISKPVFYVGVGFAIALRVLFIVLSLRNLTPILAGFTITLFVVFFMYATWMSRSERVDVKVSYELE